MNRIPCSAILLLLVGCVGCSSLGFSSYPVAHVLTEQTEAVLAASPTMAPAPRELAMEVLPVYYLQPGDELLIELIDGATEIRLPADQQVAADGSLDLGESGRVVVAARTLEQAEQLIQQTIEAAADADGAVNVRLIQPVLRYYVIGEVNSPGAYPLTGHESVLDGIMAAGGLTSRASACDLLLARPTDPCSCRVTLPVCYRAITQLGDTTTNYQLKPGDRIFVGRQSFCEELLACCSQKTCDRCCRKQTACCDPQVATFAAPSFLDPAIKRIWPPPEMIGSPSDTDEESTRSEQPSRLPDVQVRPWSEPDPQQSSPTERRSTPPSQPPAPSTQPTQPEPSEPAVPSRLDGELDFDQPLIEGGNGAS